MKLKLDENLGLRGQNMLVTGQHSKDETRSGEHHEKGRGGAGRTADGLARDAPATFGATIFSCPTRNE